MITIPLIKRLSEMFNADQTYCDDPLRQSLFDHTVAYIESEEYADIQWNAVKNGVAVKDFLSDVYIYITRDRPIKVNKLIAKEVHDGEPKWSTLEYDDVRYMQGIVTHRKFLF